MSKIPLEDYDDVLLPKDLQKILHIGRSTVYRLLSNGTIKSMRIGSAYRIPKAYLENFLYKDNQTRKEERKEFMKHFSPLTDVSITRDDLKDIRFEADGYVAYIKGLKLTYEDSLSMENDLMLITSIEPLPGSPDHATPAVVEKAAVPASAKTVEEMFDRAIEYSILDPKNSSEKKAPAFIGAIYGMQDNLGFAKKRCGSGNIPFEEFCYEMGYWWVAELCDVPRAQGIERKFFDAWIDRI